MELIESLRIACDFQCDRLYAFKLCWIFLFVLRLRFTRTANELCDVMRSKKNIELIVIWRLTAHVIQIPDDRHRLIGRASISIELFGINLFLVAPNRFLLYTIFVLCRNSVAIFVEHDATNNNQNELEWKGEHRNDNRFVIFGLDSPMLQHWD